MEYLLICITSFIASFITLFSGFGLGTVLMPVFALFFPLPLAIASTAVVHFANNLFKIGVVGKFANWNVVLRFGLPAALASALGAYLLILVSEWPSLFSYTIQNREFKVTWIGLSIGLIIMITSLLELVPKLSKISFSSKYIPLGGLLSGFFGGISGNQGVLRSAFLIKAGLNKEEFIGTGVVSSAIVDIVRLLIYGISFYLKKISDIIWADMYGILLAASFTAFLGSYIASKVIHKITFKTVQILVGIMLFIFGITMTLGLV